MGLTHSHNLLTEPVTLNRMRYVCQRNSRLPPQVQKFNVELLANDLNKLGFNIRLTDSRGNRLSNEKICNEIYKSRPSVEGICMATDNRVSNAKIVELVRYFNHHFGTNIALTENPMDPDSRKRTIPELCDDLYMVQDKISRKLSDNADAVKRSLNEQIGQLRMQQQVLDESFGRHLNLLRHSPELGTNMDKMRDRLNAATAVRESLVGEMGRQTAFATELYSDLESQLQSRFYPNIKHMQGVLNQYYHTPYDGTVRNVMLNVNNILSGTKAMAPSIEAYRECMKKLNVTIEQIRDENFDKILDVAIKTLEENGTPLAGLTECQQNLRNQRDIILQAMAREDAAQKLSKDLGYDGPAGIVYTASGGGDDRQSFWVDADASESAFVY